MNFTQKSLFSIVGKFGGAVLSLISSIFLARYIGVKGIGQYQLIVSTQIIILTVLAMGYGNASIYFINSNQIGKKTIVSVLLKTFLIISIFVSIFFIIGLNYFENYFGTLKLYSTIIFSTGAASLLIYSVLNPVLYVNLEVVKMQILSLLSTSIFLIGIILFYNFFAFDIDIVIMLVGIGNIIPLLLLIFYLKSDIDLKTKIDIKLLKRIFMYGIKISATNLVFLLSSNLVVFMLKTLTTDGFTAIGLFSRATAISNMFILIPASIGPLIYSKWARAGRDKLKEDVEKTVRLLSFISFFAIFAIFLFGKYILLILYGKEFLPANGPLNILAISFIFSSITTVFINLFSGIGKPLVTLQVFTCSLIITAVTGLILIPHFNIIGASFSVLLGIVFNAVILFVLAKKELKINIFSSFIIKKSDILFLLKALKII